MRKRGRAGLRRRVRTQFEALRDLMLACGTIGEWMTLSELARLTGYGEASISAQLRHLRKPQYGAFVVTKRCRQGAALGGRCGPVWEYLLRRRARGKRSENTVPTRTSTSVSPGAAVLIQQSQKRRPLEAQRKQVCPSAAFGVNRTPRMAQ